MGDEHRRDLGRLVRRRWGYILGRQFARAPGIRPALLKKKSKSRTGGWAGATPQVAAARRLAVAAARGAFFGNTCAGNSLSKRIGNVAYNSQPHTRKRRIPMFKSGWSRRAQIEDFEARQMMAGDMQAFVQNGTLFIKEADGHVGGHQNVQVSQLPNGKIRVQGTTSPINPTGSLVNGKPLIEFDFLTVSSIRTNLGAGQDSVHVIGSPNRFLGGSLIINTGDPSAGLPPIYVPV